MRHRCVRSNLNNYLGAKSAARVEECGRAWKSVEGHGRAWKSVEGRGRGVRVRPDGKAFIHEE